MKTPSRILNIGLVLVALAALSVTGLSQRTIDKKKLKEANKIAANAAKTST